METPKELLISDISCTAHWRWEKAEEFPTHARNMKAASALHELEVFIESLPEDHLVFESYLNWTWDSELDNHFQVYVNEFLRTYGFQRKADPAAFIFGIIDFRIKEQI